MLPSYLKNNNGWQVKYSLGTGMKYSLGTAMESGIIICTSPDSYLNPYFDDIFTSICNDAQAHKYTELYGKGVLIIEFMDVFSNIEEIAEIQKQTLHTMDKTKILDVIDRIILTNRSVNIDLLD